MEAQTDALASFWRKSVYEKNSQFLSKSAKSQQNPCVLDFVLVLGAVKGGNPAKAILIKTQFQPIIANVL